MSKEMTKSDEETEALKVWRSQQPAPPGKFNTIKLDNTKFDLKTEKKNPNFGKIFAYSYLDGEEIIEEIGEGSVFYPAHVRVQISCRDYEADPKTDKQRAKYWCRETNMGEDIELMDAEGTVVYQGPYKGAKEEFSLKYQVAIYTWYGEKLYRWKLGGGSLSSWFDVSNEVRDTGWPCYVKVKSVTEQKNNTIFWNDIEFEIEEKFDVMKAVELRNSVDDLLEEYYAKRKKSDAQVEEVKKVFLDESSDEPGESDLPF